MRYSYDGINFTEEFTEEGTIKSYGEVPGDYVGYRIVDEDFDSSLLVPEDAGKYEWTRQADEVFFGERYIIDFSHSSISKFYSKNLENGIFYEYSPASLGIIFQKEQNSSFIDLDDNYYFTAKLVFSSDETDLYSIFLTNEGNYQLSCSAANINLTDYSLQKDNNIPVHLQEIQITLYNKQTNEPILIKNIYASFGLQEDMAKFSLNASNITAAIDSTKLLFNTNGLSIYNGGLQIFKQIGDKDAVFYGDASGNLTLQGTIIADAGIIGGEQGGWHIGQGELYSFITQNGVKLYTGMRSNNVWSYNNSSIRFYAGLKPITSAASESPTDVSSTFMVTADGSLYAQKASIAGNITATSGHINGDFYVGPEPENDTAGIILHGANNKDSFIGSSKFASGALGTGWKISSDGSAEFTNINARGRISSSVFEYSKVSSIGGSLYIAPTLYLNESSFQTIIDEDLEQGYIYVTWSYPEANLKSSEICGKVWKIGEELKLSGILVSQEQIISPDENEVTILEQPYELANILATIHNIEVIGEENQPASPSIITLKIKSSDIFKNETSNIVFDSKFLYYFSAGVTLILYSSLTKNNNKVARQGIYLTAAAKDSPYIDIYDEIANEGAADIPLPKVRLGNLSGIVNDLFTKNSSPLTGYGLYGSNVYLTGEFVLPNVGISNQNIIAYDGVQYLDAANNQDKTIRIWAGAERPYIKNSNGDDSIDESAKIAPFIVTQDGALYASKGIFSGEVNATSGTFSGVIKAAGIIIDRKDIDNTSPLKGSEHFFVGYEEDPQTFDDYILNINKDGLSIWEGALRVYSDSASYNTNLIKTNRIYGYDDNYTEPLPYFYLSDSFTNKNNIALLDNRVIAYKNHIFQLLEPNIDSFIQWNSTLLDNGIWFASGITAFQGDDLSSKQKLELEAYESTKTRTNGIYSANNDLCFTSNSRYLFTSGAQLEIQTNINMVGINNKASINIGEIQIQEVKLDSDASIAGINFI